MKPASPGTSFPIGPLPPNGSPPGNVYVVAYYINHTVLISMTIQAIAIQRLKYDGIGGVSAAGEAEPSHKQSLKMAFADWRTWCLVVMYMLATGSQTIQYFVPTLVGQLGYTGVSKQYMTIPIYMVALVFILTFCFISDFRKERGNYVSITSAIAGICFIIVVAVGNVHVKYAFLCFAVGGVYATCPLTLLVS